MIKAYHFDPHLKNFNFLDLNFVVIQFFKKFPMKTFKLIYVLFQSVQQLCSFFKTVFLRSMFRVFNHYALFKV